MDHSQHMGMNQSKEEKEKELESQKKKVTFLLPITITIFLLMIWEMLSNTIGNFPTFIIPMSTFQSISFILATIIYFTVGMEFNKEVVTFVKHKVANMYTLIGIGTSVAYIYSTIILLFPQIKNSLGLPDAVYFDVTIVVIGFVYLGKYLESKSKLSTGQAIEKLLNLQAKTAIVKRNNVEMEINIDEIGRAHV